MTQERSKSCFLAFSEREGEMHVFTIDDDDDESGDGPVKRMDGMIVVFTALGKISYGAKPRSFASAILHGIKLGASAAYAFATGYITR